MWGGRECEGRRQFKQAAILDLPPRRPRVLRVTRRGSRQPVTAMMTRTTRGCSEERLNVEPLAALEARVERPQCQSPAVLRAVFVLGLPLESNTLSLSLFILSSSVCFLQRERFVWHGILFEEPNPTVWKIPRCYTNEGGVIERIAGAIEARAASSVS